MYIKDWLKEIPIDQVVEGLGLDLQKHWTNGHGDAYL
jgi:hypothetical protein